MDVPNATTVNPMIVSDTPNELAVITAPLTKTWAPTIIPTKPNIENNIDFLVGEDGKIDEDKLKKTYLHFPKRNGYDAQTFSICDKFFVKSIQFVSKDHPSNDLYDDYLLLDFNSNSQSNPPGCARLSYPQNTEDAKIEFRVYQQEQSSCPTLDISYL